MLTYSQTAGTMRDAAGNLYGTGYSGHGDGKNKPAAQSIPNVGPIPQGRYSIGKPYDSTHTGPFTLPLIGLSIDKCFGRSDFRIHGDSREHPGEASHGCIILPRDVRERINATNTDRLLEVIA
jgi:hypothetical protein